MAQVQGHRGTGASLGADHEADLAAAHSTRLGLGTFADSIRLSAAANRIGAPVTRSMSKRRWQHNSRTGAASDETAGLRCVTIHLEHWRLRPKAGPRMSARLSGRPGVSGDGGVRILHGAPHEHLVAHGRQRLYDVQVQPQALALRGCCHVTTGSVIDP